MFFTFLPNWFSSTIKKISLAPDWWDVFLVGGASHEPYRQQKVSSRLNNKSRILASLLQTISVLTNDFRSHRGERERGESGDVIV